MIASLKGSKGLFPFAVATLGLGIFIGMTELLSGLASVSGTPGDGNGPPASNFPIVAALALTGVGTASLTAALWTHKSSRIAFLALLGSLLLGFGVYLSVSMIGICNTAPLDSYAWRFCDGVNAPNETLKRRITRSGLSIAIGCIFCILALVFYRSDQS